MSLEQKVLDSLLNMGMDVDLDLFLDSSGDEEIEEDWQLGWNDDFEVE